MEKMAPCLVDYEGAMKRLGGDRALFGQLIQIYDEDAPALLDAIRQAVEANNPQLLEQAAHRLKGLLANFGAEEATGLARELEQGGNTGRLHEAPQTLVCLERELIRLHDALGKYRRG